MTVELLVQTQRHRQGLIDRYLEGSLSKDQEFVFERLFFEDAELARELEVAQLMKMEFSSPAVLDVRPSRIPWAIAACATLILVGTIANHLSKQSKTLLEQQDLLTELASVTQPNAISQLIELTPMRDSGTNGISVDLDLKNGTHDVIGFFIDNLPSGFRLWRASLVSDEEVIWRGERVPVRASDLGLFVTVPVALVSPGQYELVIEFLENEETGKAVKIERFHFSTHSKK